MLDAGNHNISSVRFVFVICYEYVQQFKWADGGGGTTIATWIFFSYFDFCCWRMDFDIFSHRETELLSYIGDR